MSPIFSKNVSSTELFFRTVNGSKLKLIDKSVKTKNVMKFVLYKNIHLNVNITILVLLGTIVLWKTFNIFIPFIGCVLLLVLQFISFITSVNKDILIVVESVGIYIEERRIFYGLNSCEFIPWDTVVDIFINEVIIGKMPGIYVRKTSWIDWTQKKESLTLTVPGSYWLCHKNNIYKFVFKYHRTTRNEKQFNFEKELMKIIRRIIKNQPPRKQQFCTRNLLVTFNRTSWTRQDKIFAMMKLKKQSLVAFSHAFILTIKLFHSVEMEQNLCKITSFPSNDTLIYQNENSNNIHTYNNKNEKEDKKCLIHSSKNDYSKKDNQYENIFQSNNNIVNDNFKKLSVNEESKKQIMNREDTNKFYKNQNISFEDNNQLSLEKIDRKSNELSDDKIKLNKDNIQKNFVEYKDDFINNTKMLNNNGTFDDINADSANLPYQYLIEKEIENAKRNIKKYGLEEVNEKNTTNYIPSNIMKMQESSCPKRRKYALNNESRSSDITDLVMEGLMFTIRQGKDAVAVIEQKTKLEVDEVLENSEKIEIKKDEKCLRNSSLLGLENLITMIELPKKNESENKYQNVINQEYTLRNKSINKHIFNNIKYPLTNNKINEQNIAEVEHIKWNTCNNSILASTSFSYNNNSLDITNKYCYTETYNDYKCKEDINFIVNKNLKYKEEKEEEEEDIIPEVLQDAIFQPSDLSHKLDKCEDKLQLISNKDLLMDDIDNEELKSEIGKNEFNFHLNKNSHSKIYLKNDNPDYNSSINSVLNETQKLCNNTIYESTYKDTRKLSVPVIISNQVITLDQIPLPLQKMLKNRLSMKQNSLNNENKINKDNIESCNIQLCQVKNNVSNIEVENRNANSNILSKHYQKSIKDNKEICDKNILSPILKKEMKEIKYSDIAKNNVKKELQEEKNYIDKTKLPLMKIKDITQEFYKDLSYLQKKKNLTNQKYLRSRRKSLILNDTRNDEMHIQMVKFFQDITRGAKVVIRRININKYS
ncbi:MATH and LRR domain-containing protein PFE0570w isoform X1 [Apis cerana]|uniref:MATH and LRR domain-containing protein PFE0570w isoform X1 n=2 Tax=Apis cerana TaxID=7461 RepID=UPI002B232890|nr:MATH and LRR domain-containing protein PFE0570w isoform X1 [Apis cerana]